MDLNAYPPPDLAIESDVTSNTTLEIYARLQVPEVWIYRNRTLTIYLLQNQTYVESSQSLIFQNFLIQTLVPTLLDRATLQGTSRMLRSFRSELIQGETINPNLTL